MTTSTAATATVGSSLVFIGTKSQTPCLGTKSQTRMVFIGMNAGMARLGAEVPARGTLGGPEGHRKVSWTRRGCSSFGGSPRYVKMQCPMRIQLRFPQAKRMMQARAGNKMPEESLLPQCQQ